MVIRIEKKDNIAVHEDKNNKNGLREQKVEGFGYMGIKICGDINEKRWIE